MGVCTLCNLFLSCSAFSFRLVPASNTTSEISSNPEREKQPTNMGEDTFLLGHIVIFLYIDTVHEIPNPHTFYSLQDTFNI